LRIKEYPSLYEHIYGNTKTGISNSGKDI
jgi:hypothetical protein